MFGIITALVLSASFVGPGQVSTAGCGPQDCCVVCPCPDADCGLCCPGACEDRPASEACAEQGGCRASPASTTPDAADVAAAIPKPASPTVQTGGRQCDGAGPKCCGGC